LRNILIIEEKYNEGPLLKLSVVLSDVPHNVVIPGSSVTEYCI